MKRMAESDGKSYLVLTAAAASWGVATVISKQAVTEIPPLALLPIQLITSLLVLGALKGVKGRQPWTRETTRLGLLGFLNPGLSYALGLIGLTQITASLSVVLWATEPIMILVLAALLLHETITRSMALAIGLTSIGVLLAAGEANTRGTLLGISFTLAGVAACAIYTVITRRWLGEDSTLTVIGAQQACALIFALGLLGTLMLRGETFAVASWSRGAWVSALVSGVLYYALAFWLYLTGLRRIPAALAGLFLNLIPIFGVGAGYLLGERLSALQTLGAVLIVGAVGSTLWAHARSIPLTAQVSSIIVDDR
ncbi:MAG TPA: DMT family transporter [Acidimicrobiia bacterium]|nr:DMT family transporter [Acidimicrobiia bacterium]